ncbi:hypothetical protein HPB49_000224 [Dermacentor silvarum]|uniref:Uncharacterized protein n=2 Tax=Dermacentor silvarum TaxID=543639 RepID=A0ACB8DLW4_DERSI|nr:hypothetical protein HPB49_000224 [Dermacentor silvarum]
MDGCVGVISLEKDTRLQPCFSRLSFISLFASFLPAHDTGFLDNPCLPELTVAAGVAATATRPCPDPLHSTAAAPLGEARHVGDEPAGSQHSGRCYKCPFCGKLFEKRWFLQRHVRIHTGDKPFRCQICPAAFNQKSNLVVHTRRHTGEKRYLCHLCPMAFSWWSSFAKHLQKHGVQASPQ